MRTLIQIGAGPNGLIQAIKILEKHQGKINYRIFDMRQEKDLNKLTALIFLKKSAIEQLGPDIIASLLTPDPVTKRPMAYRCVDGFFKEDVMPVSLADLQRVLIRHLKERFHVDIQRGYEAIRFEKQGEIKYAVFHYTEEEAIRETKIAYDLCTLSFGSKAVKHSSMNMNYTLFHQTPVIMARFQLKRDYASITSLEQRVDKPLMQVFPLDSEKTYIGLMVTPHQVGFFATASWEEARRYKDDVQARLSRIDALLSTVQHACPEITEAIGNSAPVLTDVILAEKSLSDSISIEQGVALTGDALSVSPWIFGNELNHSISYLLKGYLQLVDQIIHANNATQYVDALETYKREMTRKINHLGNVAFNMLVDPYGHTRTPEGYKVALLPAIKSRLMPEGIEEHLPSVETTCGNMGYFRPYLTWLEIKTGNLFQGATPPSIDKPERKQYKEKIIS